MKTFELINPKYTSRKLGIWYYCSALPELKVNKLIHKSSKFKTVVLRNHFLTLVGIFLK